MWLSQPNIVQSALEDAPYIFPYFFDLKKIKLNWQGEKLVAKMIDDPKLKMWSYCYFEANQQSLGAVNFWTYFKQFTNTSFCCFRRDNQDVSIVRVNLFSTDHLQPIENFHESIKQMKEKNLPFLFNGDSSRIELSMSMEIGVNDFAFPNEYKGIDELAFFSTKKGLYPDRTTDNYWSDHVLIILRPRKDAVEIIPLDWFNKSDADFGYVWPTRIARSKIDNRFYGQGIRMANFILDPAGKQRVDEFNNGIK